MNGTQHHMTFCHFCKKSYADFNGHLTRKTHRTNYENHIQNSVAPVTTEVQRPKQVSDSSDPYIYYNNPKETVQVFNSIVVDEIIKGEVASLNLEVRNSDEQQFNIFNYDWSIRVKEDDCSFTISLKCSGPMYVDIQVQVYDSCDEISKFSRTIQLQPGQLQSITDLREDVSDTNSGARTVRALLTRVNKEAEEPINLDSHCTREARAFLQWSIKYNLPEKCTDEALQFWHVGFQPKNVPRSMYQLKKWSRVALPSLVQYTSVDRDGNRFWYYKPQDVARVMLADPEYTEGWLDKYVDGVVRHQMNSLGCKEIQQAVQQHLARGANLLLPQIFYDDYSISQFSSIECDDLLMNFANANTEVQLDRSRKYLICSMTANKWDILRTVLIPFIQELESGTFTAYFAPLKRDVTFAGSLHAFIGDYMGHCEMSGLIGPKANRPSRLTLNSKEDLSSDKRPARDPIETYDDLREMEAAALIGTKKRAKELRAKHGLIDCNEMSPLWQLSVLRSNFFKRFAPCLLHNEVLGNLLRHLKLLGQLIGEKNIAKVNERVKSYPTWAGAAPVDSMYSIVVSKVSKAKEIKVVYTTGPKLQTLYQIATVVLKKYISASHLKLLSLHINIMQRLHVQEWPSSNIELLASDIKSLRFQLREGFGEDSWCTPKFETLGAWPEFINFLGPPYLLSTQTWEAAHQQSRKSYKLTNRQVLARDLLKKVSNAIFAKHHLQFPSSESQTKYQKMIQSMQPKKHNQYNYKIIGRTTTQLSPFLIGLLKETSKAMDDKLTSRPASVKLCSGFYYDKSIIRPSYSISYESPLSNTIINYGQIQQVYAIQFDSKGPEEVWLHIKPFKSLKEDDASNLLLTPCASQLIPMGSRDFKLISVEHIIKEFEIVPTKSPFHFADRDGDLVIKNIAKLSEGDRPLLLDALLAEDILRVFIEDEQDLDFLVDLLTQRNRLEILQMLHVRITIIDAFIIKLAPVLQTCQVDGLQLLLPRNNFDPMLRALKHHKTLKILKLNMDYMPDNFDSLVDAVTNDNLVVFELSIINELPEQEFISLWSALKPLLSANKSLKTITMALSNSTVYPALGEILSKNTMIQQIELRNWLGNFSASNMRLLCNGIISNSTLQKISVEKLSDGAASILFALLAHDRCQLQSIYIDSTTLADEDVKILSESMKMNTTLTELVFDWCNMDDEISVLCEGLKYNKTLRYLGLQGDDLTHTETMTAMCDMLTLNDTLTTLNLTNCTINNDNCHVIGRMLMENKSLTDLTLIANGFDDDGVIAICEALTHNTTLKKLLLGPGDVTTRAMTGVKYLMVHNCTLRHLKVWLYIPADPELTADLICQGIKHNDCIVNLELFCNPLYENDSVEKLIGALQDNYALDYISLNDRNCPLKAASRPILHRNRQLKSSIKFKVAILSHNIARSDHALMILPREIWQLILSSITSPGMEPFNDFVTTIFNSYE